MHSDCSRPFLALAVVLALIVSAGCSGSVGRVAAGKPSREPLHAVGEEKEDHIDAKKVNRLINELAKGKTLGKDPTADTDFDDAVQKLTTQGAAIEKVLIERLGTDPDWGVRYGILHVLDSVGTRRAIPAILPCLRDEEPIVAFKANATLEGMTGHQIIPTAPVAGDPFPPIPASSGVADTDLAAWASWYGLHGEELGRRWQQWWDGPGAKAVIK
jgi:hypothetical protein